MELLDKPFSVIIRLDEEEVESIGKINKMMMRAINAKETEGYDPSFFVFDQFLRLVASLPYADFFDVRATIIDKLHKNSQRKPQTPPPT